MDGINVALFLVRCTTGLLLGDTIPMEKYVFTDPDTCRSEASRLVKVRSVKSGSDVWMAKCHFVSISSENRDLHQALNLLY